jgi:hypothetical protein
MEISCKGGVALPALVILGFECQRLVGYLTDPGTYSPNPEK